MKILCFVSSRDSCSSSSSRLDSGLHLHRALESVARRRVLYAGRTASDAMCTSHTRSRMSAASSPAQFSTAMSARSAAPPAVLPTPSDTARSHLLAPRSSSRSIPPVTASVAVLAEQTRFDTLNLCLTACQSRIFFSVVSFMMHVQFIYSELRHLCQRCDNLHLRLD